MSMEREDEAQGEVDRHVIGRGGYHEGSRSKYRQNNCPLMVSLENDLGAVDVDHVLQDRRLRVAGEVSPSGSERHRGRHRETRTDAEHGVDGD